MTRLTLYICNVYSGCFCPPGTVELNDSCVRPSECPLADVCTLPPVTGLCEAFIPSFFYNSTSEKCEEFVYGGCGGNGNRFATVKECNKTCTVNKCTLSPETGRCRARIPSYFYNSTAKQCEMFTYGGCGGNDNRFETEKLCLEACGGIYVFVNL